jgi:hypothetical protein
MGLVAAGLAVVAALLLLSFYVHARVVSPGEKALVDSLKLQAKTDAGIQKVLQPELDRQHQELVIRRNAYRWGGLLLLLSTGAFFAWFKWLRPRPDEWLGVPQGLVTYLELDRDLLSSAQTHTRASPRETAVPRSAVSAPLAPPVSVAVQAAAAAEPIDLGPVDDILESEGRGRESVIPILQAIQARYRFLPQAALRRVSATTSITPADVAGVASFYGAWASPRDPTPIRPAVSRSIAWPASDRAAWPR